VARRFKVHVHAVLVAAEQLRATRAHAVDHRPAHDAVLAVQFALGVSTAGALGDALLVGGTCEVV
jgi:hypothetical protein